MIMYLPVWIFTDFIRLLNVQDRDGNNIVLQAALRGYLSMLYFMLQMVPRDQLRAVVTDENDNHESVLMLCRLQPTKGQILAHHIRVSKSGNRRYSMNGSPMLLVFSVISTNQDLIELESSMSTYNVTSEHYSRPSGAAIREKVRRVSSDSSIPALIVILGNGDAVSTDDLLADMQHEAMNGKPKVQ